MVLYVFLIAIANLSLGFAASVYLGYRYRWLLSVEPGDEGPDDWSEECLTAVDAINQTVLEAEAVLAPTDGEPPEETGDEHAAAAAAVEGVKDAAGQFDDKVADLVAQLRLFAEQGDAEKAAACVESLRASNDGQLAACERAEEEIEWWRCDRQELQPLGDNLLAAIGREKAEIEDANRAIGEFHVQGDLSASCRRVTDRADRLLEANQCLRKAAEETLATLPRCAIAKNERLKPESSSDRVGGPADQQGLEALLADWWEHDRQRTRKLSLALFDVDQVGQLNERFGHKAIDRVLRAVGRLFKSECGTGNSIVRLGGPRFVLLAKDADSRSAAHQAERLRQILQTAHFRFEDDEIRATTSCGVIESKRDDTSETLLARAQATLEQAKRYGRNRTFIHDGKYPSPVVPPSFPITDRFLDV